MAGKVSRKKRCDCPLISHRLEGRRRRRNGRLYHIVLTAHVKIEKMESELVVAYFLSTVRGYAILGRFYGVWV